MPDEVRANPADLGRAAQLCLTESIALFDALRTARGDVSMGSSTISNTASAAAVAGAHTTVVEAAGTAVEGLVAVLEHDVDALYQTAFAYQEADREAAAALNGQLTPGMPIPL